MSSHFSRLPFFLQLRILVPCSLFLVHSSVLSTSLPSSFQGEEQGLGNKKLSQNIQQDHHVGAHGVCPRGGRRPPLHRDRLLR